MDSRKAVPVRDIGTGSIIPEDDQEIELAVFSGQLQWCCKGMVTGIGISRTTPVRTEEFNDFFIF